MSPSLACHAVRRLTLLCLVLAGMLLAPASWAALGLSARVGEHEAWPHVAVLLDPAGRGSAQQLIERPDEFQPPGRLGANLGRRGGAVWLRVPVKVADGQAVPWVLNIDYAPLDRIDVHVFDGSLLVQREVLGDRLPLWERPMPTRSHAVALDLPPASERTLLLRIETTGSMLAPITLYTHERFEFHESREQALQGLISGAGLILLLYSLSQWMMLRDPVFGLYALTLLGTTAFFAALSGVGPQHAWPDHEWLTRNAPPFAILLGVCGAFFFVHRVLGLAQHAPRAGRLVFAAGAVAGLAALAFLSGLIDYLAAQAIGMALGPLPLVLVLPTAFRRMRQGDRAASFLLAGWGFYCVGVLVLVGVLAGWFPVGFWSMHAFQLASMVEMVMWMLVLAERVQDVRRQAFVLQADRDRLHSLAHTDALTGLLNRRGLQDAMAPLLSSCQPRQALALYLIDLDGFKPVNDTLGHDAGDELLIAVGRRLRDSLRSGDLVCRLGGDEFVLVASGFGRDADARRLGDKILQSFHEPFTVAGHPCRIGLTIGYALAPLDATSLYGLLKSADQAMYAGKQAGKNQLQRAGTTALRSELR